MCGFGKFYVKRFMAVVVELFCQVYAIRLEFAADVFVFCRIEFNEDVGEFLRI